MQNASQLGSSASNTERRRRLYKPRFSRPVRGAGTTWDGAPLERPPQAKHISSSINMWDGDEIGKTTTCVDGVG